MANFGTILKQLRLQAGMTQEELANKLGVTKSVVSYYELSKRAPSAEMLLKIANSFYVTTDYLLGLDDAKKMIRVTNLLPEDVELMRVVATALRAKQQKEKE